jgi:glycosyltransferase involved in cell wall biosynthesis
VAHYTSALLGALSARDQDDEWHVLVLGDGPAGVPDVPNVVVHRHRGPARAMRAAAAVAGRPRFDRLIDAELDVFWAPAPAPLALSPEVPLVLTLHDLSWLQRPSDFTRYERLWHAVARPQRLARRAGAVLAVSEATRVAALAAWSLDPAAVTVVRSGVERGSVPDAGAVAAARTRCGLPERYLLFLGALEPRKAPDLLVRAFGRARAAGLDAELALIGEGRLGPKLTEPGVHRLGRVDSTTRDALLAGALALVLPSRLEGFGFPPLEALALGTPSVLSDLPAFRETLGDDGALHVPVDDETALADALLRIAADGELRERVLAAGAKAAAPLTWEQAAERTHAALVRAAGTA